MCAGESIRAKVVSLALVFILGFGSLIGCTGSSDDVSTGLANTGTSEQASEAIEEAKRIEAEALARAEADRKAAEEAAAQADADRKAAEEAAAKAEEERRAAEEAAKAEEERQAAEEAAQAEAEEKSAPGSRSGCGRCSAD